ncbi:hypothetical protein BamMC406_3178 [Burkholderia ambifaria MC40-6]|jgi:hypothetical protein|uniref:Uncharacterized protein n=1 Tax=Burkholderia ambifaria (strain MC40-6) TaxID=398577 RepID=B1YXV1_BURA4|nr:hypothetical protein [Burkholderia ambifaria]ACB65651.1 hypothetical protein BamMC406_3178 [Burkholderia ambifaria MC40-6]
MNSPELVSDLETNIQHQIKKIGYLYSQREITNRQYFNEFANPKKEFDEGSAILNQAYSDAVLNSMGSLIDYYCICCALKIGIPVKKIKKVQYRSLTNKFLIDNSSLSKSDKATATIGTLQNIFNKKYPELAVLGGHGYWMGFLGEAISHTLKEYGALDRSQFEPIFHASEARLEIDPKIEKYYHYMRPLFCNIANRSGIRHNIYIDINNFLKHNAVPYLSTKIEIFEEERRFFSYFEIKHTHRDFLKDGILKDLVETSFEKLKTDLETKHVSGKYGAYLCGLEQAWGLGPVLDIDFVNGYISPDKKTLYFFVDTVLMAKTESATLIDADGSLLQSLQALAREIDRGLNFKF